MIGGGVFKCTSSSGTISCGVCIDIRCSIMGDNFRCKGVVGNAEALVVAVGAVNAVNEPSEEKVYYYTILVAMWQNHVLVMYIYCQV